MIRWGLALTLLAAPAAALAIDIVEQPIDALAAEMAAGRTSAVALVKAYQARIAKIDSKLHAVIAVDPDALAQARTLDAERKAGRVRGPLHGVPILIKDNIESAGTLPTTAGSIALAHNVTGRDAPVVARLRAAGAIILGKTNLSEWANFRSLKSTSGWSAVGGLTHNPYALDRNPCGSSAGSGAAAAASLAAATIGTETDGSIVCPSSLNGLVGLKPTVGLVSRTHIIPISARQDTAGPMGRSVRDVALLLGAMAGSDAADPATTQSDAHKIDYAAALDAGALKGKRIGVMRFAAGFHPAVDALFDNAIADLKKGGAEIVEIPAFDLRPIRAITRDLLSAEFKEGINAYLASTDPSEVPSRNLTALIAFNKAHADAEMPWFGQEIFGFAEAAKPVTDPAVQKDAATATRLAGVEGIDAMLAKDRLDALIAPTNPPAWPSDLVNGGGASGGGASTLPAVAGYPHLTVPMGPVKGLPVGLSFIGPAWSEAKLLAIGYAYEQATHRREPPRYLASVP
ncbi:amidase [Sphingomonas crocodyli]|uniref:Amidase n=1 Tax=Sphingomonas crocodyli TaxID=1979270 RepID=A0A437LWF0_9SPHN|nr:amidase [Sphingomonas crocodyli]RVT89710.1 amidase [Sphingomonas crocodyli]